MSSFAVRAKQAARLTLVSSHCPANEMTPPPPTSPPADPDATTLLDRDDFSRRLDTAEDIAVFEGFVRGALMPGSIEGEDESAAEEPFTETVSLEEVSLPLSLSLSLL